MTAARRLVQPAPEARPTAIEPRARAVYAETLPVLADREHRGRRQAATPTTMRRVWLLMTHGTIAGVYRTKTQASAAERVRAKQTPELLHWVEGPFVRQEDEQ